MGKCQQATLLKLVAKKWKLPQVAQPQSLPKEEADATVPVLATINRSPSLVLASAVIKPDVNVANAIHVHVGMPANVASVIHASAKM